MLQYQCSKLMLSGYSTVGVEVGPKGAFCARFLRFRWTFFPSEHSKCFSLHLSHGCEPFRLRGRHWCVQYATRSANVAVTHFLLVFPTLIAFYKIKLPSLTQRYQIMLTGLYAILNIVLCCRREVISDGVVGINWWGFNQRWLWSITVCVYRYFRSMIKGCRSILRLRCWVKAVHYQSSLRRKLSTTENLRAMLIVGGRWKSSV